MKVQSHHFLYAKGKDYKLKLDQMTKTKAREMLKAKAVFCYQHLQIVLKYLMLLLQHPSKLKYF